MGELRQIEGGRAIEARDVQSQFSDKSTELLKSCENMAGFALVVWDDEGNMESSYYRGRRDPYGISIVDYVNRLISADVVST